jgi:phage terminase small subunit
MVRGRKPTPTHLKVLRGNPGKRALPKNEPQPQGEVEKPRFLKGRAAKLWDQYAPELIRLRVLTVIDAHNFAAWCSLAAEFEKDPAGMVAAKIGQMRGLASSFGMDAAARARLGGSGEKPAEDPFVEYMRGKSA